MLSHEKNPPTLVKPIGKSTVQHNSSDENATGDKDLPEVEHQLISPSVDAHDFSIRDFVLAARSKDIGTNWPFSDKHLKLCLMHGVKELLPPFQSKTSKRKQSSTVGLEKSSLVDDLIVRRVSDEGPSTKVDSLAACNLGDFAPTQTIAVDHLDVNFDISDKDSEFPSSVTSNSLSYPSGSGGTSKSHKFGKTSAKLSAKKCKLIVKFGSPSVHSSNEGIMPQKTNLSDSPASKVCPVCKTFSSSSNTTLNAHIDQCLSMEATSEGMTDSKVGTKCKVKARKMRSMVDIYATALECTIEDLDRRNGSSWATDLTAPVQNNGVSSGQRSKKKMTSPTEPDNEDNDDGGVYIDANGRKLRILSKMDSFSSAGTTKDGHESKKPQASNILSRSKENQLGHMRHKHLRLAVSDKNFSAPKANSSKVWRSQKSSNNALLHEDKAFQAKGSTETDEPDVLRAKGFNQYAEHKLSTVQRSVVKSQKSRLGCFGVETSSSQDFSRDSTCLIERRKKMKASDGIRISSKSCLGVKRTGFLASSYSKDMNCHKRLRKSIECVSKSNCASQNSFRKPVKKRNRSEKESGEKQLRTVKSAEDTKHIDQFMQKSNVLHRNNSSSLSQLSVHEPQFWKKCLTNEEDRMQIEVEEEDEYDEDSYSDEDAARWRSEGHVMHDNVPETRIDESEQDRRAVRSSSNDGALNMSADTCDEFVSNLGAPLSRGGVFEPERSEIRTAPCMNLTAERTMGSFIRSMNHDVHNQEKAYSYDYQSTSPRQFNDSSAGPSSAARPPNAAFNIMDLDSNDAQGNRCDIDPIPIPGPPGSFLPSPGKAVTEDYQENSSLTASVKSSHEHGDGNSYNSLNSAASSISNLAAEMSEKVTEKSPSTGVPDSSPSGYRVPSSEVSTDKACKLPHSINFGASQNEYGKQNSILEPQEENQHCCCSQRGRVLRGSTVDYQDSQLLRRRIVSAIALPAKENISCSLNTAPSYSCAGSDIYSFSSSSSTQVQAIPISCTSVGFPSPKYPDTTNTVKSHNNGDLSASPSTVLRLMGKNLMVVKNDEDLSGPLGDANSQMLRCKAASPGNLSNSAHCSQYQRTVSSDPAMIFPSTSSPRHSLDFRMPNGPWGRINFPRPDFTNYSQTMLDQIHRGPPTATDFTKHDRISDSQVGAVKNNAPIWKGTGAPVVAEHDQLRIMNPMYPNFQPALSSCPIYMQQGARNTCFMSPPQMSYSQNVPYALQGGPFMTSSPSMHTKPGLFYSPGLPQP